MAETPERQFYRDDAENAFRFEMPPVIKDRKGNPLQLELAIKVTSQIFVYHYEEWEKDPDYFEYNLKTGRMTIVLQGGERRDIGDPIDLTYAKYIQNAYQVYVVHREKGTETMIGGAPYPIILQS